jgi:hypothetical protein
VISRLRLAAILLPLSTWTVYVFIAASVGSIGCGHGRIAGLDARRLALLVVVVAGASLLAAGAVSAGRRAQRGPAPNHGASGAAGFLFLLSVVASAMGLLFLLWVVAAAVAEPACA